MSYRSRWIAPLRSLPVAGLGGLLVLGLLGPAAPALGQQGLAGFDSSAPVDYEADSIVLQDKQSRVVLSGNVAINQGDMKLRAARTTVAYLNQGGVKIQRIDAAGGVTVTRGGETASGDVGVYDFNRRQITLAGRVALRRGSDTLNGARLVIDLNTGLASVDGRGPASGAAAGTPATRGGRVSGSFTVPKQN